MALQKCSSTKTASRRTSAERGFQQQKRMPVLLPPRLSPLRQRHAISTGLRWCEPGSRQSSACIVNVPPDYLLECIQSGGVLMSPPMLPCAVTELGKLGGAAMGTEMAAASD